MAFKDITAYFYPDANGEPQIKLDYKDKAHRYYAYPRINTELPVEDRKAWGKLIYPKGTTTLLDSTLEKNGLMTWPMGMALQELFGFYNFEADNGQKLKGYMKEKIVNHSSGQLVETGRFIGTMWDTDPNVPHSRALSHEELLPILTSAQGNANRRKKKGADIGSVVHNAIEHYVLLNPNQPVQATEKADNEVGFVGVNNEDGSPKAVLPDLLPSAFDIPEQYMWGIKDSEYESEADQMQALVDFESDTAQANKAFEAFRLWWDETRPVLYGAEEILYSMKNNVCGTYDADIGIKAEHHPVWHDLGQKEIRVTTDWKTSNASKSIDAGMPQGIKYTYFIQNAIYEICRREMGKPPADDLLVVSARKDGGFTLVYASELGLTVGDCIAWAEAVILCNKLMTQAKKGLWEHHAKDNPKEKEV